MSAAEAPAAGTEIADPEAAERCTVCEHALADHDRISLRFCHATQDNALTRQCLCRP